MVPNSAKHLRLKGPEWVKGPFIKIYSSRLFLSMASEKTDLYELVI